MKTSRSRDKAWLSTVREQACAICASPFTVPHHVMFTDHPALSLKVSDYNTIALCGQHHRDLHMHGNEEQWWALEGVDPIEWIKELRTLHTDTKP